MAENQTIANKVREATKDNPGKTAAEIAALLGTKRSYVHTVWYMDRKKGRKSTPRRMGRPPKTAQERTINPVTLDAIKKINEDLNNSRIQKLEAKIQELNTVINFLEARIWGGRGASV